MIRSMVIFHLLTANTQKIAEAINEGASEAGAQSTIASIDKVNPRGLGKYGLIGLGSLVLVFQEPLNVSRFIAAMKGVDGRHAFAFCTHGALPGNHSTTPMIVSHPMHPDCRDLDQQSGCIYSLSSTCQPDRGTDPWTCGNFTTSPIASM